MFARMRYIGLCSAHFICRLSAPSVSHSCVRVLCVSCVFSVGHCEFGCHYSAVPGKTHLTDHLLYV